MSTATDNDRPTVTQFTDPMCTWCWGSEPIVRHLRVAYGQQLRIEYVMGGLVEDFDSFDDATNNISEPGDVAPHWVEASEQHGMPVDTAIFESDPARSTYPASVAFAAARDQDTDLAHRYLRRLRATYATLGRNINDRTVQVDLAADVGLDVEEFTAALEDGTAEAAFEADLARTRRAGVRAFPTYRVDGSEGNWTAAGFQTFDDLATALADVAPALEQSSPPPVRQFVSAYGPVATQEVAEVYHLSPGKAKQTLQSLADDGTLVREQRGNGLFWRTSEWGEN